MLSCQEVLDKLRQARTDMTLVVVSGEGLRGEVGPSRIYRLKLRVPDYCHHIVSIPRQTRELRWACHNAVGHGQSSPSWSTIRSPFPRRGAAR
jgi:hypothetical protein